jgi:NhaP-type Na+/H+ or K+/H+ antiporter
MTEQSKTVPIFFLFFAALLALVLLLSKALHNRPKLNSILSEPAMVLLVGIFFSFVVSSFFMVEGKSNTSEEEDSGGVDDLTATILSFPSNVFFMALLPPILFNSGYQLQRDLFYRHFKPITLFAVLGTTISGFATGFTLYGVKLLGWMGGFDPSLLELLTFGALIAATDTVSVLGVLQAKRVDPHLFSLVFGESALNDAVAILLFRTMADILREGVDNSVSLLHAVGMFARDLCFEAVGSPVLGIVFAFLIALVFKHADLRDTKILELSLYILLMYIPFVLAEVCYLSGIVTIFFTGMSARRYIEPNVSEDTKRNAEMIFKLTAYLAETCIFLELGLSVCSLSGSFEWQFIGCALAAALLGRAASVYPISVMFNLSIKENMVVEEPLLDIQIDDLSSGSASTVSTSSSLFSSGRKRFRLKRKTPEKRKDKKVPSNFMHVMWFAGLRGAVAAACARDFPDVYGHNDEFIAATMVIVLFTIIVMGGATEPLLKYLEIRMSVDEVEYMKIWRSRRRLKGVFHDFGKYLYSFLMR